MRAHEDSDVSLIAKQMTALSSQVSLLDSQSAERILADLAELHVEDPTLVHWWEALRNAETLYYGSDSAAWKAILIQKILQMEGECLFVAVTDDVGGPWPVLRVENKLILPQLIESLQFFEYMAFQEDRRSVLFDTHGNTIVSSSL